MSRGPERGKDREVRHHELPMTRVGIASFVLIVLAASGCGRKPTTPPEEAPAKATSFAPAEEHELAGDGGEAVAEEEDAPGMGGS